MSLSAGHRLGPYEIVAAIGEGGMGQVYRATDTRLKRQVAIKILPATLAADADRLVRFQREAEVLASLNHPNIAGLHGLEESDGVTALVMELVEGDDLSDRIARGSMPLDEVLPIARQIAEALEAAHEQGIVHRDLKPANIKVRPDGTVKVLDFGLAKALDPVGSGAAASGALPSMSPTVLSPTMTSAGLILGTATYMSPEQARGKPVDRRADIWSFGLILAELVTGERVFGGEGISEVLAKIIEREPNLSKLPANAPPSLVRLITRCLTKDPRQRLRDIGDARIEIAAAERELASGVMSRVDAVAPGVARAAPRWRVVLPWVLAGVLLLAFAATLLRDRVTSPAGATPTRLQMGLPPGAELYMATGSAMSVSPDGSTLAFVGVGYGIRQLYLRRLNEFEMSPVRGTETAVSCVFSPDGRELLIGMSDTSLRRLRVADGVIDVVTPTSSEFLGGWLSDGRVVFTKEGRLWVQGAAGTPAVQVTKPETAAPTTVESMPVPVRSRNAMLFASSRPESPDTGRIDALDLDTMTRTTVVERAAAPVLTASGHLLFLREGAVLAARFDAATLTLAGEATPVLRDVHIVRNRGVSSVLTVSDTGTLVYVSTSAAQSEVVSVSRAGEERTLTSVARTVANPRLTPDGRWLLFEEVGGGLWLHDLERRTLSRLTDGTTLAAFPIFTADGREVVFRSPSGMFRQSINGGATATRIDGSQPNEYPNGLTPDGRTLLYTRISSSTAGDLYEIPLVGGTPTSLVMTPAYEGAAQVSRDGKWLLYVSNERGTSEIFLQSYPTPTGRVQVSSGGGVQPAWSAKGGEIVYRNGDKLMSVRVTSGPDGPVLSPSVALFASRYAYGGGLTIPNYGVASDGDRFVFVKERAGGSVNVVLNWFEELKRVK